ALPNNCGDHATWVLCRPPGGYSSHLPPPVFAPTARRFRSPPQRVHEHAADVAESEKVHSSCRDSPGWPCRRDDSPSSTPRKRVVPDMRTLLSAQGIEGIGGAAALTTA